MNKLTDAKNVVTKKVDEIKQTDISIGTKFEISVTQFGATILKVVGIIALVLTVLRIVSKLKR